MRSIRNVFVGVGLLLGAVASPLPGQGIGTPEYYVIEGREAFAAKSYSSAAVNFRQAAMLRPDNAEYHFLLGTALASDGRWDEAREVFAKAVALQPDLRARTDQWLAGSPGAKAAAAPPAARPAAPARPATPGRSATPAKPATPAGPARPAAKPAPPRGPADRPDPRPAGTFAVGDRVEIAYRADEWFPGVVTSVDPGACPSYRVRSDPYGKGNPSELVYGCSSVRAPTGIAEAKAACGGGNPNCPPTSAPPLGTYLCSEQVWQGPGAVPQYRPRYHGPLTLLGGNRYRMFEGGAVGRYQYDRATYRISWIGAAMAGRGAIATYGLDGKTPEITITFDTEHSRSTGNAGPRWECALQR